MVEAYLKVLAQIGKLGFAMNDTVERLTVFEVNINLT